MSKHTPGPWRLAISGEGDIGYDESDIAYVESEDVEGNGLYVIARCNGPDRNGNAALIAAAPDLLAALKQCFRDPNHYKSHDMAKAAIAKAEGAL